MALINCPECDKKISDKSVICIHCGYPLAEQYSCIESTSNQGLENETERNQEKSQSLTIKILVSLIVVLLIIFFILLGKFI